MADLFDVDGAGEGYVLARVTFGLFLSEHLRVFKSSQAYPDTLLIVPKIASSNWRMMAGRDQYFLAFCHNNGDRPDLLGYQARPAFSI